jgi:hypothetical protein
MRYVRASIDEAEARGILAVAARSVEFAVADLH